MRRLNIVRKHQEMMFLLNIATERREKLDSYYAEDWTQSHKGTTGRHRSDLVFGKETKED